MADELRARLALRAMPGTTEAERLELLRCHGSAAAVLAAGAALLGRERAAALRSDRVAERVAAAARTVARLGARVLAPIDTDFPPLRPPIESPAILFALGNLELLRRPCVAVVGTRRCTEYGEDIAAELATELSRAGVVVISGLARGIDGVAHRAALGAGGATVAVLGCGLDVAYPREHERLQAEIAEAGLLLSEFLPGEPPRPHHFLQRNRLIAGYAAAVVVVEGGASSGAINTAHHALGADIPLFGVPGPLGRGTSDGPLALLRDGALLYTEPLDVLLAVGCVGGAASGTPVSLGAGGSPAAAPAAPPAGRIAVAGLTMHAQHIDSISAERGETPAATLASLLELELAGHVEQLPGMRFRLAKKAATSGARTANARNRAAPPG